jgi:dihydrofolate synthase / folylpolyglutamate synthase
VPSYAEALGRLYALVGRGKRQDLGPMTEACALFGNPERAFKAVHVAGTNGKGTVSAFLASMSQAAGVETGLYTSPHLVRFAERIRIQGEPLRDERLAFWIDEVLERAPHLTFFEATTLIAFLAFRESGVQRAIIEVGLGGRLDATNVIPPPEVAIVTRVAYDHMEELGNSLTSIAREKAAIIKPGCLVVVGKLHPDALSEVQLRTREVGATLRARRLRTHACPWSAVTSRSPSPQAVRWESLPNTSRAASKRSTGPAAMSSYTETGKSSRYSTVPTIQMGRSPSATRWIPICSM